MWKLWHRLFGWHYVEYRDTCTNFIARIKPMPNGKVRMVTTTGVYDAFLLPDGRFEETSGRWSALTFDDRLTLTARGSRQ